MNKKIFLFIVMIVQFSYGSNTGFMLEVNQYSLILDKVYLDKNVNEEREYKLFTSWHGCGGIAQGSHYDNLRIRNVTIPAYSKTAPFKNFSKEEGNIFSFIQNSIHPIDPSKPSTTTEISLINEVYGNSFEANHCGIHINLYSTVFHFNQPELSLKSCMEKFNKDRSMSTCEIKAMTNKDGNLLFYFKLIRHKDFETEQNQILYNSSTGEPPTN